MLGSGSLEVEWMEGFDSSFAFSAWLLALLGDLATAQELGSRAAELGPDDPVLLRAE